MAIEREMDGAYLRLAEAAAAMRYRQRHYLDGRGAGRLFGPATALTAAHPWALADFGAPAWADYRPDPQAPPPDGLRVGVLRLGDGVPPVPAVARFAGHGHLLISERGFADGARSLLQALTLRLATATRPGTVRFALADPVGQGRYLSAFLRLPAQLRVGAAGGLRVGVAASPAETEALLTTLTSHVVEVTQTRLTNVYDSVETYNAATTGATVPYHVLVLAGFPAGISDRAGELLGRLARNGPRSGLYIVATVDPGLDLPRGFDLAGLTALGTTVSLDDRGDLSWDDPDFAGSVIEPDQMPGAAQANPWLDAVGAAAGSAYRDLPFGRIAVPPARRWAGNTTDGLDVQIGVDSKGEPQHFVMGVRGVHHGLVGGDVRMGKTNLLHVLISQLALGYPPEELELYLLDFKEVEFDAYLTERLPHARAITSRTDREFGLSMLRRFHEEIERRARLCREARVTDLPDYRRETGQVLPRALVIMDEFQVLFSEEDRLAREAGRLLADIAKRGAAFGLHLLLATQSPGGPLAAYLRPVYEQMALRIALGCTQPSVSQAILGEGNDTATRLVRAGDAIYNDRRGEGANPVMRIAMLPTRERLALIGDIRALGGGREYPPPASFDPDAAASFTPGDTADAAPGRPGRPDLAGRCRRGWARPSRSSPPPPRRSSATPAPTCSSWAARNTVMACCWPRCSAPRTSAPRLMSGSPSPSSPGPRRRFTGSSTRCGTCRTRCGSPTGGRRPTSWTTSPPTWRPGWRAPDPSTRPGPKGSPSRNGSSSSPGCTGGTSCWPRATTAVRARPRRAWSGWPTRVRTQASTWWPGPTVTPPPNAPCAGQAWDSSACARCSACSPPRKATRCSGCPPPRAWTTTAPCTGTPSGRSSRSRSSSRTRPPPCTHSPGKDS